MLLKSCNIPVFAHCAGSMREGDGSYRACIVLSATLQLTAPFLQLFMPLAAIRDEKRNKKASLN